LGCTAPTYRATSRLDDEVSGIRLFRVPLGVLFRDRIKFKELGLGGIEIIQPHHRHVTAWPSLHPETGQRYQWFAPDSELMAEGLVPCVEDLPELPQGWVEGLSRDSLQEEVFDGSAPNRSRAAGEQVNEELYRELLDRLGDSGPSEPLVAERLDRALREVTDGSGSRYDTTRDHTLALMRLHALGRPVWAVR
jgi:hypothetical protein